MTSKYIVLATMLCLFTSNTFANNSIPCFYLSPDYSWVGTVSAGPAWEQGGHRQSFFLAPEIEKTFITNNTSDALTDGEIFAGLQKCLPYSFQGQLGIALAAANSKLYGEIWDDASPQFDNHSFHYRIQHTHLAVEGKLLLDSGCCSLIPWIGASFGIGWNRAYGFQNTPTIFEAEPISNFTSNTESTFTYTLNAGFQKPVMQHWQVGLAYQFADLGKSQLNRAAGQTLNSGLSRSHLYTNGILFNITYLT